MSGLFNRARVGSITAGTGSFTLGSAVTGHQTFAQAGVTNGTVVRYVAETDDRTQWEVGQGTYSSSGPTLTRTTIEDNSNGDASAVNFSSPPQVWIDATAETFSERFNVKEFGARGDGVTDDTTAVRAAAAAMRAALTVVDSDITSWGGASPGYLFFPPGIYKLTGSINLQNLDPGASGMVNAQGWGVVGLGATIYASMTGKTVFDCLGSTNGLFRDFAIMADNDAPPAIGIQCGRIAQNQTPAGKHLFDNVFFSGKFSTAFILNASGEGNTYRHTNGNQQDTSGNAFGIITDGFHHITPITDFTQSTHPADTADSCIQHTFIGCDMQLVGGSAYYFTNANQVHFVGANYISTASAPGVVFQGSAGLTFRDLNFHIHVEGTPTAQVEFRRFTSGALSIDRLTAVDHSASAYTEAFIKAGTNITTLTGSDWDIFHAAAPALFSGTVTPTASKINGIRYNDTDYEAIIADDAATSFSVASLSSLQSPLVLVISSGGEAECGMVKLRCSSSPAAGLVGSASGASVAVTTGALAGTTGTDGKLTLSAADGLIYVENRTGASRSIALKAFSL